MVEEWWLWMPNWMMFTFLIWIISWKWVGRRDGSYLAGTRIVRFENQDSDYFLPWNEESNRRKTEFNFEFCYDGWWYMQEGKIGDFIIFLMIIRTFLQHWRRCYSSKVSGYSSMWWCWRLNLLRRFGPKLWYFVWRWDLSNFFGSMAGV